jgi:hypothetical protein
VFHWWEGLIAGGLATAVMTATMLVGAAVGMTRMDMPLMLGSMFRREAGSARALGWMLHFMNGLVFGLVYALVWWAIDPALDDAWWIGLLFGGVHGAVALMAMPMMSSMHPRVRQAAVGTPPGEVVLPPFGFGGIGFGAMTPLGIVMGHLVFGVVWGLVFWWLA